MFISHSLLKYHGVQPKNHLILRALHRTVGSVAQELLVGDHQLTEYHFGGLPSTLPKELFIYYLAGHTTEHTINYIDIYL